MIATRREILTAAGAGGAMLALGGCEKIVSKLTEKLGQSVPDSISPPTGAQIDPIHHLLNRAAFGAWPGDIERVRAMGAEKWIDEQLDPSSISDTLCDLRARRAEFEGHAGECYEYTKPVLREEMARHTLLQALYSKRQLFETMVSFWTDHLNINIEKGDCIYLKPWDDRNVIRKHALGKFRDLIRASATSPAMLVYLDGTQNIRANPTDVPNENYARELLELHTLGVHGGYSQHDVYETARALTGWHVRSGFMKGSVHFIAKDHDQGEKKILGHVLPPNQNEKDVEDVVDIVCQHPSTATHIATKLVRRFVAEDPPASLVRKVAGVFRATDGDIKQLVRTVLLSDEFKASAGAKFKPPFRFVVSALRAVGADTHAHSPLIAYLTRMGQGVFEYPTPDGYPDKTSPWLGTLLWRWNLAFALASNQAPAVDVPVDKLAHALAIDGNNAATRLFEHCVGHAPGPEQSAALAEARDGNANDSGATQKLLGLVLSSPGFQRY
ncbi:MAG TPA: DUF1800 domain-containing protein [Tepidisphaeraceae bacterium]|jgi:uncharacterized protein (DUF1800 family)|nr:DUF1800 domain-containing protein [Tepidisphaeraceae bacterium]